MIIIEFKTKRGKTVKFRKLMKIFCVNFHNCLIFHLTLSKHVQRNLAKNRLKE